MKKFPKCKAETYKTGGGKIETPNFTPAEEKVKRMALLTFEGLECVCDSDNPGLLRP